MLLIGYQSAIGVSWLSVGCRGGKGLCLARIWRLIGPVCLGAPVQRGPSGTQSAGLCAGVQHTQQVQQVQVQQMQQTNKVRAMASRRQLAPVK